MPMSKAFKPAKSTVELRPSRIRRDPVRVAENDRLAKDAWWESREWEIRLAVMGVIMFALALCVIMIGSSEITSH